MTTFYVPSTRLNNLTLENTEKILKSKIVAELSGGKIRQYPWPTSHIKRALLVFPNKNKIPYDAGALLLGRDVLFGWNFNLLSSKL